MLYWFFNESYAGLVDEEEKIQVPMKNSDNEKSKVTRTIRLPKYDMVAIWICYLTRFTDMFVRTNLETLGR